MKMTLPRAIVRAIVWTIAMLPAAAFCAEPHNIILFIADGLRNGSVNATDAPTLLSIRERGVNFTNSHSLYPTLTTPNASAIATGHYLGDTGDFGNSLYTGFPLFNHGNFGKPPGTPVPFVENDPTLGDLDDHTAHANYLDEETLLALARKRGYLTAAIGKLGPVAIQDVTQLEPKSGRFETPQTIILDDATGTPDGVPLSPDMQAAFAAVGLTLTPTTRSQPAGSASTPGTLVANVAQQQWFVDAATKAVLPAFVHNGRPFVLIYWSRDPDGSQHNQGDSLNKLSPGINGPTSRAGVANADKNLRQLLNYVDSNPALRGMTDVFVTSDHGFATISKHETDAQGGVTKSYSTTFTYLTTDGKPDVVPGWLPPGFLAIDLGHLLDLPLYDPDSRIPTDGAAHYEPVDPAQPASASSRQRPANGNGLIGGSGAVQEKTDAQVIVAANGGSDLIYVVDKDASGHNNSSAAGRALARRLVEFLSQQDYVGGLFVDSSFGKIPGTLPLSTIGLEGSALWPRPTLVVSFKTFRTDPADLLSTAQIADTTLQEGQGMHGSLDRSNTFNNMAVMGPDFKRGYLARGPVSNADIMPTLAHLLGLKSPSVGKLQGRVLTEAFVAGPADMKFHRDIVRSEAGSSGNETVLQLQETAGRRYFDAACFTSAKADPTAPCGEPQ